MEEHISGHLLLLMAPSGSGKGKIVESLGELQEQLYFAKTYTSRERRKGTEENPKYVFVTRDEFLRMIDEGAFIEWANFSGNLYGTPKSEVIEPLRNGKIVFKEMELQGILQMKDIVGDKHMTVVYIDAGSWEELKKRILARAEISEDELELRHQRYQEESRSKHIADVVIDNRDGRLKEAQREFRKVVEDIIAKVEENN